MNKSNQKRLKEVIKSHIINNKKEYIIVFLIFIIGIFLGVMLINNTKDSEYEALKNYIIDFMNKFKDVQNLDNAELLSLSLFNNVMLATLIWFFGTTVIGIPVVFGLVLYRGFCLGYTISSFISVLGVWKGLGFVFSSLFLQNILYIPAIVAIAVSGFKLYKSITKDRRKDNIKLEIIRHIIFSLLMVIILCLSSLVEIFVSNNILKNLITYFII